MMLEKGEERKMKDEYYKVVGAFLKRSELQKVHLSMILLLQLTMQKRGTMMSKRANVEYF